MKKIILCLSAILLMSGCSSQKMERRSQMFFDLDTTITLIAYTQSQTEFDEYAQYVEAELKRYHQIFDRFNQYEGVNNVYTLNQEAFLGPVIVDDALIEVMSIYQAQNSDMVKMSLAPVSDLWKKAEEDMVLPSADKLNELKACVDDSAVSINEQTNEVRFLSECTKIDLGAVAKGYIIEQIALELENMGLEHAILNGGGNVRTIGSNLDDAPWRIGIVNPDFPLDADNTKMIVLIDHSSSVVTSGDYQRYFELDGVRYHHLLDATTLQPSRLYRSVSIIYDDSAMADYYSTLLFLTPLEQGRQLVKDTPGLEAVWILNDGTVIESDNVPSQ